MTDTGELLAFINARLAEDETGFPLGTHPPTCASVNPAALPWSMVFQVACNCDAGRRGQAEITAKRAIMDLHVPVTLYAGHPLVRPVPGATRLVCRSCEPPAGSADAVPCPTMLALTLAYRGHPDWREEWAA